MRTPHYWRQAGRTACPSSMIVFDTETYPQRHPTVPGAEWHRLNVGVALAYRLEGGRRTRLQEKIFHSPADFWSLVERRLDKDRPLWLVAHNTAFDLGVLGGWGRLSAADCEWSRVVLERGICYMRGLMRGKPLVIADTGNYYRMPLAAIGASLGRPKKTMPGFGEPIDRWIDYCREDVHITADAIDGLIAFWREHELGPWAPTISSLAFSAYRHRFMAEKVLVHADPRALALERAAYYGGRVDTPLVGVRVGVPVTECDFVSLYPSTYREPLPYYLEGVATDPRPEWVLGWLRQGDVIADTTLRTSEDTYPCRVGQRVYHPVGTYRTTLAAPELRRAVESGHVLRVHVAAFYRSAPIFRGFLEYLYPLKAKYQSEGNHSFRNVVKLLLNSLYGKTGQLSPRWMPFGAPALTALEETYGLAAGSLGHYARLDLTPADTWTEEHWPELPEPLGVRCLFGLTEIQVGESESRDSCPAIAATVTSYGRLRLTQAQTAAGSGHWYYSDTDSVWCDAAGVENLERAGLLGDGRLGMLDRVKRVDGFLVHGRKDYEHHGGRRLKGVRSGVLPDRDGGYHQLHFPSAMGQLHDRLSDGVLLRAVVKHLRRTVDWCTVHPSGWTEPLNFSGNILDTTAGGV